MTLATSRRSTLHGAMAGFAVFFTAVDSQTTLANINAGPGADATLIDACHRLATVHDDMEALYIQRMTIEDERATQPTLDALCARQKIIEKHIESLPAPVTFDGARILAQTIAKTWPRDRNGDLDIDTFNESFVMSLVEYFTREMVIAP